jgi:hypothetical protein
MVPLLDRQTGHSSLPLAGRMRASPAAAATRLAWDDSRERRAMARRRLLSLTKRVSEEARAGCSVIVPSERDRRPGTDFRFALAKQERHDAVLLPVGVRPSGGVGFFPPAAGSG